ncbi:hypothetical protein [Roseomonas sp. BN140053]|uniref:hypothetical protein n=1 Tax=Roseomonas sp. BN140053 TaxID=3391898 RepID=UPI0039E98C49
MDYHTEPAVPDRDTAALGTRLLVLEMTIAAIAARLPQDDLAEIVSMLVFVAKTSDAARDLDCVPADTPHVREAGLYAAEMLERISKSRKPRERGMATADAAFSDAQQHVE